MLPLLGRNGAAEPQQESHPACSRSLLKREAGRTPAEVSGITPEAGLSISGLNPRYYLPHDQAPRPQGRMRVAPLSLGSQVVHALRHIQTASGAPVAEHRPQAGGAGSIPALGSIPSHLIGRVAAYRRRAQRTPPSKGCGFKSHRSSIHPLTEPQAHGRNK